MQQQQRALYLIGLQARGKSISFSEGFQNKQTNKQMRKISDLSTLKRNAERSSRSVPRPNWGLQVRGKSTQINKILKFSKTNKQTNKKETQKKTEPSRKSQT